MIESVDSDTEDADGPPEEPSASDCCNSGCTTCVFDLYRDRLGDWKNKKRQKTGANIRNDLLSETKFKSFVLLKKTDVARNSYLLRFKPLSAETDDYKGCLPYDPGQHFIMKIESETTKETVPPVLTTVGDNVERKEQKFTTRAYTPITLSTEQRDCCFEIVVKLYEDGKMSERIRTLAVGDMAYFRGPYGEFRYSSNVSGPRNALMMCIGTGIAPIYAILRRILSEEQDETVIKLLYGCRTVEDILLRHQLAEFTSFWNFSLTYFLTSNPTDGFTPRFGEHFVFNRINETDIMDESRRIQSMRDHLVLICGTDEFCGMALDVCIRSGLHKNSVHVF